MKAGQFETSFIIQTYNRLSRSLSRVAARSYIYTSPEISVRFYDFLAEGILISWTTSPVLFPLSLRRTIRNLTGSQRYTKCAIILKPEWEREKKKKKRIPQWTFYIFFEKAILNGCRVRAYFILLPGILYYLSIEKPENLKFRKYELNILIELFRCDKNISSREGEFRPISIIPKLKRLIFEVSREE